MTTTSNSGFSARPKARVSSTLNYSRLKKTSVDISIIKELGGQNMAETFLWEVFALMEQQPNGEEGVLLNNGCVNIFYVYDVMNGTLRAVGVDWDGDGWCADASQVEDPGVWFADSRVFSRN